ncbi:DEKNAAC104434 [Brettanomyces naardenensis]|uniref:DEKNAAC104434 n=1 Tax=Brettanomyces naardenensis TaxID=13370 RepID=A0A448YQV9_BRENA|nr:DEKNAAC104434 [Brettanomyces naardenensis]
MVILASIGINYFQAWMQEALGYGDDAGCTIPCRPGAKLFTVHIFRLGSALVPICIQYVF